MRRPVLAVGLGIALIAGVLGFVVYEGISNNLVYYITPSELLAKGAAADGQSLRVGGLVRAGSRHWDPATQTLRFVLQDPKASVAVISHGLPPQMFREGAGVVVEGVFRHGLFRATTLMIKHCSTYRAPKPGQTPPPDSCVTA
jgi:cytochrome c-type biogenesis protein CcmE